MVQSVYEGSMHQFLVNAEFPALAQVISSPLDKRPGQRLIIKALSQIKQKARVVSYGCMVEVLPSAKALLLGLSHLQ